jgi:hypothetical protein
VRIKVTDTIGDLADDLARIATESHLDMAEVVKKNAQGGERYARGFAKQTARRHGKHYPSAITSEAIGALVWEYGPDSSLPQGGMSFEYGSRNQPPHLDLARSADIVGPRFAQEVSRLPGRWFW